MVKSLLFSPTPSIRWQRSGGDQLPPGHEILESGTTLVLNSVDFDYEGPYECVGSNNVDTVTQIIQINVECKYHIPSNIVVSLVCTYVCFQQLFNSTSSWPSDHHVSASLFSCALTVTIQCVTGCVWIMYCISPSQFQLSQNGPPKKAKS